MMKQISKILFIFGMIGVVGAGVLLYILGLKSAQSVQGEIYMVVPKKAGNVALDFSKEEIETLRKKYKDLPIAYEMTKDETLQNMGKSADISLVMTTADYLATCGGFIGQGNFFLEDNPHENEVVVDERAAFALWGTEDCLGETLEIDGTRWHIIGIARSKDTSKKSGSPRIYLLGSHLKEETAGHLIYIRFDSALKSQNEGTIKKMLEEIGRQENDYDIVWLSGYRRQIAQNFSQYISGLIMMFLVGGLSIVCYLISKHYTYWKKIKSQYYIGDYVKAHWLKLGILGAIYIGSMSVMLWLIKSLASFELDTLIGGVTFKAAAYKLPVAICKLQSEMTMGRGICVLGLVIGLLIIAVGLKKIMRLLVDIEFCE